MKFIPITTFAETFILLSGCSEASIDSPEKAAQVATTKSEHYQNTYPYLGNEENQTRISSAPVTYMNEYDNVFPASDGQVNWLNGQATPLTYIDTQSINKNPKDYESKLVKYERALDALDGDYLYFWGVLTGNSSYQNVDNGITPISDFVASHVKGY
ncbi:hypothetical protein [Exiguobacterium profundum]